MHSPLNSSKPQFFKASTLLNQGAFFFCEIENIYNIRRKPEQREQSFIYIGCSLGLSLTTRKKNKETNSSTNGATTQKTKQNQNLNGPSQNIFVIPIQIGTCIPK
jgi:hypothetical protein